MRKPNRYIVAQYSPWWWAIIDTNTNLYVKGPNGPYKLLLFKSKIDAVNKCVELNKEGSYDIR